MNFVNEYALLFAVALPVVAVLGIQVYLFACGERGTLLIPGLNRYPSIEYSGTEAVATAAPTQVVPASFGETATASSNDEIERQAA